MGLSRRKFTTEFKEEAVRRLETGTSLAEVAGACAVSPNVLSRWKRELAGYGVRTGVRNGHAPSDEQQAVERERQGICQTIQMLGSDARTLTRTEYSLLALLVQHVGVIVPRETLLKHLWGQAAGVRARTLDVHIHRLRKKLGTQADQHIETVCGMGYRLHTLRCAAAPEAPEGLNR